jgi:ankyrin repeat protein
MLVSLRGNGSRAVRPPLAPTPLPPALIPAPNNRTLPQTKAGSDPATAMRPSPPLHQAARDGDVAAIAELLAAGPPNLADRSDDYGYTPLQVAAEAGQAAAVTALLDAGAGVNRENREDGRTALHYAAIGNKADVVALLLARGADAAAQDMGECRAVSLAASAGATAALKLLLDEAARGEALAGLVQTAAQVCGAHGGERVERLVAANQPTSYQQTQRPHPTPPQAGHLETLALLLDQGADPNAMARGTFPLLSAALAGNTDVVRVLLDKGADVQVAEKFG